MMAVAFGILRTFVAQNRHDVRLVKMYLLETTCNRNHCKIQNNVSIFDNVKLEDGVFCGPSMVFTNVYNPRALIERKEEYRDTLVKHGATLGANCTILCGLTIGRFVFVGAGAVITKDAPDFALMVGVPGRQIGWMSAYGERLDLPLTGAAKARCHHTGVQYQLDNGKVSMTEAK